MVNSTNIHRHVSLKPYNTFGIDVAAEYMVEIHSKEELVTALDDESLRELPILVLGGGSNILFTGDVKGLVLLDRLTGIELLSQNDEYITIKAGAGVNWHELVIYTVKQGWGGLENLSLIPGTVGAAPIQNLSLIHI